MPDTYIDKKKDSNGNTQCWMYACHTALDIGSLEIPPKLITSLFHFIYVYMYIYINKIIKSIKNVHAEDRL